MDKGTIKQRKTAVLAGLAAAAILWRAAGSAPARAAGPAVGDLSAPFSVTDTSRRQYSLGQLKADGRTTIVFFWTMRSAPCLKELAYLEVLHRKYGGKGLVILAVESGRNGGPQLAEIMEKLRNVDVNPSYPIIPDIEGRMSALFGLKDPPQTWMISSDGVIVFRLDDFSEERKAFIEGKVAAVFDPTAARERPAEVSSSGAPAAPRTSVVEAPSIHKEMTTQQGTDTGRDEEFEKNRYFGEFYANRKEYDRALSYYEKCVALDPKSIQAWLKIGEIQAARKDFAKAREAWEEVIRLDPGNVEADANIRRLIRGDYY